MSSSVYGSTNTAERENGLAMHTKMLRYARVVSVSPLKASAGLQSYLNGQELNRKRLRKETFAICRALEETVKDETVSADTVFQMKSVAQVPEIHFITHRIPHSRILGRGITSR